MKKMLSVTFFTGLLTLSRMMAGFIISKFIAVYTGANGMALLGQTQNLITILNGIVSAPVGNALVRYTSENNQDGYQRCVPWWRASIAWAMIFCSISVPVGVICSRKISNLLLDSDEFVWLICIIFIGLPFSALSTAINSIINGLQNYKRYVSLGIISIVISTIVMLVLIILYDVRGALIAVGIQSSLIGIILFTVNIRQPWLNFKMWLGSFGLVHFKGVSEYILMAITAAVSMPLALMIVRKIIIYHEGWNAAGQWQAVWKISEVYLSVITTSLGIYFLPQLSKLNKVELIKEEIKKSIKLIIPVSVCMAFGIYFLRDIIITVLFTDSFRPARDLFMMQLIGDVLKVVSWVYAYPMIAKGITRWFIISEIIFATLFALLTLILVPIYHANGANIAYAINYFCYLIFVYFGMQYFLSKKMRS